MGEIKKRAYVNTAMNALIWEALLILRKWLCLKFMKMDI